MLLSVPLDFRYSGNDKMFSLENLLRYSDNIIPMASQLF